MNQTLKVTCTILVAYACSSCAVDRVSLDARVTSSPTPDMLSPEPCPPLCTMHMPLCCCKAAGGED